MRRGGAIGVVLDEVEVVDDDVLLDDGLVGEIVAAVVEVVEVVEVVGGVVTSAVTDLSAAGSRRTTDTSTVAHAASSDTTRSAARNGARRARMRPELAREDRPTLDTVAV